MKNLTQKTVNQFANRIHNLVCDMEDLKEATIDCHGEDSKQAYRLLDTYTHLKNAHTTLLNVG